MIDQNSYTQTSYLKDQERNQVISFIRQNLSRHEQSLLEVDADGYVNVNAQSYLVPANCVIDGKLQFKFGAVRTLDLSNIGLTSMYGLPQVSQLLNLSKNNISSLDDMSQMYCKTLNLSENPITSLKDIHKKLFGCEGIRLEIDYLTSNTLGLMMIKGFVGVYPSDKKPSLIQKQQVSYKVISMINWHITNKKSVLECQEELMDAGYKEFAKF